jgi:hypothetical protein
MEYTGHIHGYTMYIHRSGYTWYIHGYLVYSHSISMVYPWMYMVYPWIYMANHLMYIHGIYVEYPWIFLDTRSFLKPNFFSGLCCWSNSMRTRVWVWVIKSVLFHTTPWQMCHGEKAALATKGSTRLQQTSPLCRWRRR